jgi:hypothetical protein
MVPSERLARWNFAGFAIEAIVLLYRYANPLSTLRGLPGSALPWLELSWTDGGYNAWQLEAAVAKMPRLV